MSKPEPAAAVPAEPASFRTREFLLDHVARSLHFFDPARCVDPAGGHFHFFGEEGQVYDRTTRVLVTEARFIFTYATAYQYFKREEYRAAAAHGIAFLRGPLRNVENGAYHWVLKDGVPSDSKIYTYALAFVLLAYARAAAIGVEGCAAHCRETFEILEKRIWDGQRGLYAEEADAGWNLSPYRSESGNLHMTEALLAAYEATGENLYLDRAALVADRVCNGLAGQTQGLVWEHFREDWSADTDFQNGDATLQIFRPWGFQPGHQVEWARLLLCLNRHRPAIWLVPKARFLFDVALVQAWDPGHGGLAYSFGPDGAPCDWDKIFWVQCEAIGTAAMLAAETGREEYWEAYDRLWRYSWRTLVDHAHGSWRRRCDRKGVPHFLEKTKLSLCVDPDYHILGGLGGAIEWLAAKAALGGQRAQ